MTKTRTRTETTASTRPDKTGQDTTHDKDKTIARQGKKGVLQELLRFSYVFLFPSHDKRQNKTNQDKDRDKNKDKTKQGKDYKRKRQYKRQVKTKSRAQRSIK